MRPRTSRIGREMLDKRIDDILKEQRAREKALFEGPGKVKPLSCEQFVEKMLRLRGEDA